jgi:hypothetical protein
LARREHPSCSTLVGYSRDAASFCPSYRVVRRIQRQTKAMRRRTDRTLHAARQFAEVWPSILAK